MPSYYSKWCECEIKREAAEAQIGREDVWRKRLVAFLDDTGQRDKFLRWMAKDCGLSDATIDAIFDAAPDDDQREQLKSVPSVIPTQDRGASIS